VFFFKELYGKFHELDELKGWQQEFCVTWTDYSAKVFFFNHWMIYLAYEGKHGGLVMVHFINIIS